MKKLEKILSKKIDKLKTKIANYQGITVEDLEDWRKNIDEEYYEEIEENDFAQLFDFVLNDDMPLSNLLMSKEFVNELSNNDILLEKLDEKFDMDLGKRIKMLNDYILNIKNGDEKTLEDVKIKAMILFKGNKIESFAEYIEEPYRSLFLTLISIVYGYIYSHDDFIEEFDWETTEEDIRNFFSVEDMYILGENNLNIINSNWAKVTIYYDESLEELEETEKLENNSNSISEEDDSDEDYDNSETDEEMYNETTDDSEDSEEFDEYEDDENDMQENYIKAFEDEVDFEEQLDFPDSE